MNSSTKVPENVGKLHWHWLSGLALATLVLGLAAYLAICIGIYVYQARLVFEPDKHLKGTPADLGLSYEDVALAADDGTRLHAWYVPAASPRRHVLFLHGNGGNMSYNLRTVATLHAMGHAVLTVDYRGYGRSAGSPSEDGIYQDAAAAWDYLVAQRRVAARDIVIYGRSLGGAVAVWLATHRDPGGLILESTFTRMADMGALRYPILPVALLTRIHFDSLALIAAVRCPILAAHGRDDVTVPFAQGQALAHAAGAHAEFVALDGGHGDAFLRGGENYYRRLDRFIAGAAGD